MSRVKSQCKRCGRCCVVPLHVYLVRKERKKNEFKMIYSKNVSAWILKKKIAFVPEIKKKRLVCYYYDPEARACLIHKNKPEGCKSFNCQRKPIEWIDDWFDYLKQ